MADSKLNYFLSSGTAAERVAFTPSPPTPAAGHAYTYVWFEEDTKRFYLWDAPAAAWRLGGGGSIAPGTRVRAATTANITIATALNNGDSLDGVSLVTGDLVLVKDQSSASENGIYEVAASPERHIGFSAFNDHPGLVVTVQEGTVNLDSVWLCTSNAGGTLGATSIAFTLINNAVRGKGALVRKAADHTGQNLTGIVNLAFDQEAFDDLGFHDNAVQNTRLTIPAGVQRVKVQASVRLDNVTTGNSISIALLKDGSSSFDGACGATMEHTLTGSLSISFASGTIPVVAGNYFEVAVFVETDNSVDVDAERTMFSIEVVK